MSTTFLQKLCINFDRQCKEITHMRADKIRILPGVLISLNHQKRQMVELVDNKIAAHKSKLENSKVTSHTIIFRCLHYQLPSLKCLVPILSPDQKMNAFSNLYAAILFKLKVMRAFLMTMKSILPFLGRLDLCLLKVESIAKVLH